LIWWLSRSASFKCDNKGMNVTVHLNSFHVALSRAQLEAILKYIFFAIKYNSIDELSLNFINNAQMQRLNRQYRHKNNPTDVLSFNLGQPQGGQGAWADIFIALAVAKTQASQAGHSVNQEILTLMIHASLHLAGFDHLKKLDTMRMLKKQQTVEKMLRKQFKNIHD
jgi:probable rRNA maturation factor